MKKINHIKLLDILLKENQYINKIPPFYLKCYRALSQTQPGEILTYKKLADLLESRAFRAVGNAMRNNDFPILIPCHRVVSKSGIGGYMGITSKLNKINSLDFLNKTLDLEINEFEFFSKLPSPIKTKLALLKFERIR
ncbi:MAG: methylated-DNA--[protein]-cysteine S-methyltransferase [Candidatus Lokiarchaeota archaeon]|nr:methylated-DNA--[protein]-cysteine S-methyltransferase [Candidatus Lokiarchaeota archaeon]